MNYLYFGDNLEVLRRYVKDESVNLVYLDPPFNSKQDYNVLFRDVKGTKSAAQIQAFEDTWHWDAAAAEAFHESVTTGPAKVADVLRAFEIVVGHNDMLAYLSMMAPRLVELHRVLKPTGSLYLHCDPTASHYLKLLCDSVFGPQNFLSEVVWKRTSAHTAKRYAPVHDTLLYYSRSEVYTWNPAFQPLPQETIDQWYNNIEPETGRRFNRADLTAAGIRTGSSGLPWRGVDPTSKGRHWAIPSFVGDIVTGKDTLDALDALDAAGRIFWPKKVDGIPMVKRYVDEAKGVPALDVITDISPLNNKTAERLGYPTQKPEALLERIIAASSNHGDVLLDPFCGCGTSIAVSERLGRRWIGIDVTHLSISLMKHRLFDAFGEKVEYKVIGEPTTFDDAVALASEDRYNFQFWALGLVGARPTEEKKGADKGVDGRLYFQDDPKGGTKQVIFSVKSGKLKPEYVRELFGVINREKAEIAVLITLEEPTKPMRTEAASQGFYDSPYSGAHPRVQIITVKELLDGKRVDMPPIRHVQQTFRKAPKASGSRLIVSDSLFDPTDDE